MRRGSELDLSGSEYGPMTRSCELSYDPSISHTMQGMSCRAEKLLASQQRLCSLGVYYISTVNTQHMQSPDVITTGLYLATCFGR